MVDRNEILRLAPFNIIILAITISLAALAQAQEISALEPSSATKPAELRIAATEFRFSPQRFGSPPDRRSRWFSTTAELKRSTAFSCRAWVFACKQRPARSLERIFWSSSPENTTTIAICRVTAMRE